MHKIERDEKRKGQERTEGQATSIVVCVKAAYGQTQQLWPGLIGGITWSVSFLSIGAHEKQGNKRRTFRAFCKQTKGEKRSTLVEAADCPTVGKTTQLHQVTVQTGGKQTRYHNDENGNKNTHSRLYINRSIIFLERSEKTKTIKIDRRCLYALTIHSPVS